MSQWPGQRSLAEFVEISKRFPNILFPAVSLSQQLAKKLGFWEVYICTYDCTSFLHFYAVVVRFTNILCRNCCSESGHYRRLVVTKHDNTYTHMHTYTGIHITHTHTHTHTLRYTRAENPAVVPPPFNSHLQIYSIVIKKKFVFTSTQPMLRILASRSAHLQHQRHVI